MPPAAQACSPPHRQRAPGWQRHANFETHLVIRRRDSLEDLQALQSGLALRQFVRQHTTDRAPQDLGRRAVVDRAKLRVGVRPLAEERSVLHCTVARHTAVSELRATASSAMVRAQAQHSGTLSTPLAGATDGCPAPPPPPRAALGPACERPQPPPVPFRCR